MDFTSIQIRSIDALRMEDFDSNSCIEFIVDWSGDDFERLYIRFKGRNKK